MAAEKKEKKAYSNPYQSLEAIWTVLRRYSSAQHPMTAAEVHEKLKHMSEAEVPSRSTILRRLPEGLGAMNALFPYAVAEEGTASASNAYFAADGLHIVLETKEGKVVQRGGLGLEVTKEPMNVPSRSNVEKTLLTYQKYFDARLADAQDQGILLQLGTYPFRLRCVARVKEEGEVCFIPYEEWEDRLTEQNEGSNNVARRYYLENDLTDAEWRILADMIQVYPFISETQTQKYLQAIHQLRPVDPLRPSPSLMDSRRYAYKRGCDDLFEIIQVLDQAIRAQQEVEITYGEYCLERSGQKWKPRLRTRKKNGLLRVKPYALMWSNGNYYLVVKHEGMMNLRVDRILSAELLEGRFERPRDFHPVQYRDRSPVMYPGENTFVRLRCKTFMLNVLLDFFGSLPQYSTPEEGSFECTMSIAPGGVKLFALQYAGSVEVLEPESLRREIAETLRSALNQYES